MTVVFHSHLDPHWKKHPGTCEGWSNKTLSPTSIHRTPGVARTIFGEVGVCRCNHGQQHISCISFSVPTCSNLGPRDPLVISLVICLTTATPDIGYTSTIQRRVGVHIPVLLAIRKLNPKRSTGLQIWHAASDLVNGCTLSNCALNTLFCVCIMITCRSQK